MMAGPGISICTESQMVYVGEWESGQQNGQGTLVVDNEKYTGAFVDNQFSGQGRLDKGSNEYLEGTWANNQLIHGTHMYSMPGI